MLLRTTLLLLFVVIVIINGQAQQIPQSFKGKTHMMSEDELKNLKNLNRSFQETAPPMGEVRSIAEFERTEGIIVTFLSYSSGEGYFGIPLSLIVEISEDAYVYTIVSDSAALDYVNELYIDNNVVMDNVIYVISDANSYWSRDYSPWFIAKNDTVSIVDFPYNRPRPDDNKIPEIMGDFFSMEIYGMDLVSTGGNYMTDGRGVAASCDLVYEENSTLSQSDIDTLVGNYLGISKYHLLDDPLDDYIEHIDCWGKFLDVDKILITRVPETDYRYADFELLADYWANQESSYGNKYQVFRVFSPNGQPYTNSLILNTKVLVPIVRGFGSDYNELALDVYRSAMPGYEVIGFEDNGSSPWESTDALHCRTHEVPDQELLYIYHNPIQDSVPTEDSIVNVAFSVRSYANHEISTATLNYSINNSSFLSIDCISDSLGNYDQALNLIPGDTVQYYLLAQDSTGKEETHPFMGMLDPNTFFVEGHPEDTTENDTTVNVNYIALSNFECKVYPNPSAGKVSIALIDFPSTEATVKVIDVNGKLMFKSVLNDISAWYRTDLDLSHINSGIYFIEISVGSTRKMQKLMISK